MSSIAYITDSKMLELHRLSRNKTMNFWRLSTNINFSEFKIGDLLFFLSKDKEHMRNKEKGIVGYGRLESIHTSSVDTMWKKFESANGYPTKEEFKNALIKVSKDRQLPKKISSLYLVDVVFFQAPIYLSECGMEISNRIESYIYLNPEQVAFKILDYSKGAQDLWSTDEDADLLLEKEQIRYCLFSAHQKIGSIPTKESSIKKSNRELKHFIASNPNYAFIQDAKIECYRIYENTLEIVMAKDKEMNDRLLLGQALLYKNALKELYPYHLNLKFMTFEDGEISELKL